MVKVGTASIGPPRIGTAGIAVRTIAANDGC
jgi:hypothetical protein